MSIQQVYRGGCHCGAVQFEAETDLAQVISCNCSICLKTGSLLNFIPTMQFKLLCGESALSDYQFNKKIIHHLFCKTCGIRSFGRGVSPRGEAMIAINIRCLDNIDINSITPLLFDGKHL